MKIYLKLFLLFVAVCPLFAQENPEPERKTFEGVETTYTASQPFYTVKKYPHKFKTDKPKNVVLMIGDGMSLTQVFAGITANGGQLYLDNFRHIGLTRTQSANRYITDSAAGGTAIATGHKTNNSAVGLDAAGDTVYSILKAAQQNNLSTGIVVTTSLLDATPAAFVAHVPKRDMWDDIAAEYVDSGIDVFIGGGSKNFYDRPDKRNLFKELEKKGYKVCKTVDELTRVKGKKVAGMLPEERVSERGEQLAITTDVALDILKDDPRGFFLMVEASSIDGGGHKNDATYLVEEMLDFDKAIGCVLEFAAQDGETLVIVTADHETGGATLVGGDMKEGKVTARFTTRGHTSAMVPVFAYGPCAEEFIGINENTFFYDKIAEVLDLVIE